MPATQEDMLALAQLRGSGQRTTSAPHQIFDISQFKLQVNKEDVPEEVIEQLQQEFGDDLAGAIDKYYEMEKEKEEKSAAKSSEEKDEDVNKENEDPLGRKEFVTRDRYWNRVRRAYVLQKPQQAKASTKHKRYVLFVRRDYEEDMKTFNTVIVIYGKILRNALRNIFQGVEGFTLTENDNTELSDPRFLYWAKPELELLAEHYKAAGDKTGSFEMKAALNVIATENEEMISVLPSLLPHSITFQSLWAIVPPGSLLVGRDDLDFTGIWRVLGCAVERSQEGVFFTITGERITWDGEKMGYFSRAMRIPLFRGVKLLSDLPYIPLKYHPERDAIMEEVLERSAKNIKFWTPEFQLQEHQGTGLAEVGEAIQRYAFSGRVIIDPAMMRSTQPDNKIMPPSRFLRNVSESGRAWISDLASEEVHPQVLEGLLKDASKAALENVQNKVVRRPGMPPMITRSRCGNDITVFIPRMPGMPGTQQNTPEEPLKAAGKVTSQEPVQLSEENMLLVSSLLYGYSLQDGTWGAFAVDRVADVVWDEKIFPSLVMEQSLKNVIYQLVTAHSNDAAEFDDFVKGKGKGLIGLLFGPPGSGKTLTAEAIAETAKMPLYMVSSGALGHNPVDIHKRLSGILKLASHWKAVLLLDEADVFLAERTLTDIERNAIVSIFLRELEYYQGILLLTTNQAQVIDEAFQSRIHFSLHYPILDSAARRKIWTNFISRVRSSNGVEVSVTPEDINALAEMPLNGRQIKNTVSIAVKIAATSQKRTITSPAIVATAKLLKNQEFNGRSLRAEGEDDGAYEAQELMHGLASLSKTQSASNHQANGAVVKPVLGSGPVAGGQNWQAPAVQLAAAASLGALAVLMGSKLV